MLCLTYSTEPIPTFYRILLGIQFIRLLLFFENNFRKHLFQILGSLESFEFDELLSKTQNQQVTFDIELETSPENSAHTQHPVLKVQTIQLI